MHLITIDLLEINWVFSDIFNVDYCVCTKISLLSRVFDGSDSYILLTLRCLADL